MMRRLPRLRGLLVLASVLMAAAVPLEAREFPANVVRILDGDTVEVDVDLGLGFWKHEQLVRLEGIDAPERKGDTKAQGDLAKVALEQELLGQPITLITNEDRLDKYGRLLGRIKYRGKIINDELVKQGRAVYREY